MCATGRIRVCFRRSGEARLIQACSEEAIGAVARRRLLTAELRGQAGSQRLFPGCRRLEVCLEGPRSDCPVPPVSTHQLWRTATAA